LVFEQADEKIQLLPEPSLGDIGCLDENEDFLDIDQDTKNALIDSESDLSIRNIELIDLIV
jgi:hypothetical protein